MKVEMMVPRGRSEKKTI